MLWSLGVVAVVGGYHRHHRGWYSGCRERSLWSFQDGGGVPAIGSAGDGVGSGDADRDVGRWQW